MDWVAETFVRNEVASLVEHIVSRAGRVMAGTQVVDLGPSVRAFYASRHFQPAWVTSQGASAMAAELVAALREAGRQGLDPDRYHINAIEERWRGGGPSVLAQLDILLTDAYVLYSGELTAGRIDPRRLDTEWFIYPSRPDLAAHLSRSLTHETMADDLAVLGPRQQGYARLLAALAKYREIKAAGGWPTVAAGPDLVPGMQDQRVPVLRRRLAMTGDLASTASVTSPWFDSELGRAVRRFQARHGLSDDGWVGAQTFEALNVPVGTRLKQIRLNLERWRWLPREAAPRYLMVNMAGFELTAVEGGDTVLRMPVIVGRNHRQTPALRSRVDAVIFNPYWYVPQTVFAKDLLPKLRRDPTYLERARLTVLSSLEGQGQEVDPATIDWAAVDPERFPYVLRQDAGPYNSLGRIKFLLPNDFGIYLHDTPNRELFASRVRTYSSGCIRVRDPVELAAYVLGDDAAGIRAAIEQGTPRKVGIRQPVPVYLVYMTVWADEGGTVHFREDVYDRDRRLAEAMWPEGLRVTLND